MASVRLWYPHLGETKLDTSTHTVMESPNPVSLPVCVLCDHRSVQNNEQSRQPETKIL